MTASHRKTLITWSILVVLSVVSYLLMDGGGQRTLLYAVVFVKLERIWTVYLRASDGPLWLYRIVLGLTLVLVIILRLVS